MQRVDSKQDAGVFMTTGVSSVAQTSVDTLSIFTYWAVQAEVVYQVKDAGDLGVKYYLKRLPSKSFKKLLWTRYRHEVCVFLARDHLAACARLEVFEGLIHPPLAEVSRLFPDIPNTKIKSIQVQLISFTEQVAGVLNL